MSTPKKTKQAPIPVFTDEQKRTMAVETAAALTLNVMRGYRAALGEEAGPRWENASETIRDNYRRAVLAVLEAPHINPEDLHAKWLDQRIAEGWVYGPVKDPNKKVHPNIRPYVQLPGEQKMKDHLVQCLVREFLALHAPV